MKKVITYGTYDLLHYGHIKLLERAKELGDYLIVGVTADDFDKVRGKLNVQQSLSERLEAVKGLGIADEVIVEEYEGQKIDDIKRYEIDVFTVGSDWIGQFDYLNEYCKVVYLDRTEGISSSDLRAKQGEIKLGVVGDNNILVKYISECEYVNGIQVSGICTSNEEYIKKFSGTNISLVEEYNTLLELCDAVYLVSHPSNHYEQIKMALQHNKHVLCESPLALSVKESEELFALAIKKELVMMDAIKTAYATAYNRLILLVKSGKIGDVVSIDSTCTSLLNIEDDTEFQKQWNSICAWGPTAMLPIFHILGVDYRKKCMVSRLMDENNKFDSFTKIDYIYDSAVASIKVGQGVKSEGELVVSGTRGYVYVPAPWWKTDYFEIRYENPADNRRYFYQLEGEGIRHTLVSFVQSINSRKTNFALSEGISRAIVRDVEDFYNGHNAYYL